jgi:hypothetical protein
VVGGVLRHHERTWRRLLWFLEGRYNVRRLHSTIAYRSPLECEALHTTNIFVSPCGSPIAGRRRDLTGDRRPPVDNQRLNV